MPIERLRLFRGSTEISYAALDVTKTDDHIVNSAQADIEADSSVSISSAMDIRKADGTTSIFSCKVDNLNESTLWNLRLLTNGYELMSVPVQQVYLNTSPEGIIQDVVNNYTQDLTYAGTDSSGVTITRYIANAYAIDIIKEMLEILGWQMRIDENDNVYAEPAGSVNNGKTFTNGSDCQITSYESNKGPEFYNRVKVIGAIVTRNSNETVSGTGTEFTLAFKPIGNVKVTISGSELPMTSPTEPYTVDPENKKVTFSSSRTDPNFDYEYQLPIVVDHQDDDSISDHGTVYKEVQAPFLDTRSDIRRYARELVLLYGTPATNIKLYHVGFDFDRDAGEVVTVTDPIRGKAAIQLIIRKLTYQAATNRTVYELGTRETTFTDMQREMQERIKKLERRVQDEDEVSFSRIFRHNMKVRLSLVDFWRKNCIADSLAPSHVTLGYIRDDLNVEPDCSNQDPSSIGNMGTWQGSSIDGAQYSLAGPRLGYASFNGTDNEIAMTSSITLSGTFAVSLWIKSANSGTRMILGESGGGSIVKFGMQSSSFYVQVLNGGSADNTIAMPTANKWHHIVLKRDSSDKVDLVVNGTANRLFSDAAQSGNFVIDQVGQAGGAEYWADDMDEFMVFSSDLTTAEIAQIRANNFDQDHARYTDLEVWYAMDNPTIGDKSTAKTGIGTDNGYREYFYDEALKGSPFTANWDTTNRRLSMHTSNNHATVYNVVANSGNYSCGGAMITKVTASANQVKYGSDQIKLWLSNDGSNWEEAEFGEERTFSSVGNALYWRVVMIGSGASDTYIDNFSFAVTRD